MKTQTKDQYLLEQAYQSISENTLESTPESKPERETVTVRYEHRVIKKHDGGDYYGERIIFKPGEVLETTKSPSKRRDYGMTLGHGAGASIPPEKVGVFKVTRVTKVTETEERVE